MKPRLPSFHPHATVTRDRAAGSFVRSFAGTPVAYPLTAHDHLGGTRQVAVAHGETKVVLRPAQEGRHDVVLTADADPAWTRRYAGRIATTGRD